MTLHIGQIRIAILVYAALMILGSVLDLIFRMRELSARDVASFVVYVLYLAAFCWVWARAVLLKHMWARIAGLLFCVVMLFLPSYWKVISFPLFALFIFGWKYKDSVAEEIAKSYGWEQVPLAGRFGSAYLVYNILAIVSFKVAPVFNELYAQFGAISSINFTSHIAALGGVMLFVSAVVLLGWALYPQKNVQYVSAVRTLFWVGILCLVAALAALYGPIFVMGRTA